MKHTRILLIAMSFLIYGCSKNNSDIQKKVDDNLEVKSIEKLIGFQYLQGKNTQPIWNSSTAEIITFTNSSATITTVQKVGDPTTTLVLTNSNGVITESVATLIYLPNGNQFFKRTYTNGGYYSFQVTPSGYVVFIEDRTVWQCAEAQVSICNSTLSCRYFCRWGTAVHCFVMWIAACAVGTYK